MFLKRRVADKINRLDLTAFITSQNLMYISTKFQMLLLLI
jgi:hypothetical protein